MSLAFLLAGAMAAPAAAPAMATPATTAASSAAASDPACPPEHAAAGHCTPAAPAAATPPAPSAAPAATDPNCPPEHAAAGHCTPAAPAPAAAPPAPPRAPAAADPNCPPEHAAAGHCTPAAPAPAAAPPAPPAPAGDPNCAPEHAAAGHCTPAPPRAVDPSATGTDLPAGNAPPPAPPTARAADAFYPTAAMAMADRMMRQEHGGMTISQIMLNVAEYQARSGSDGYRWDGEGWFGGDINRLVVKSEGEGERRGGIEDAEVQALYSRAIDPYFNLQAGIRQDFGPRPRRTYATVGFEGLAPYWFEVEGALFLSNKGDLLGRVEAYYDQRLTQRLVLQPRAELEFAAQDVPESGIGSGLSSAELGLRLRYEIRREFAPYVGVTWDRKAGDTARFARAAGEGASTAAFVLGLRAWF